MMPLNAESNELRGAETVELLGNRDPNVFIVLANQARSHTPLELFATAAGGVADAAFFFARSPALWWVSSIFVAISCYGAWGLADRALDGLLPLTVEDETRVGLLQITRGAAAAAGVAAVLAALGGFMAAALGGPRW